ncbi:hypothetical protein SFRURICE_015350 [Spodoptera frugiperda]|nr:hypothetical protein SFRURICE_015350 [Spodoptera frugiperda]
MSQSSDILIPTVRTYTKNPLRVLFDYVMLRSCGCGWFPPLIFIGRHSLALVETDSTKICFYMERCTLSMRAMVLFHLRCAILCCWLPQILFIGTHGLAMLETDSVKLCFYKERCVIFLFAMDGSRTIDTSHTRAAHLPHASYKSTWSTHATSQGSQAGALVNPLGNPRLWIVREEFTVFYIPPSAEFFITEVLHNLHGVFNNSPCRFIPSILCTYE